jgi:pyruvate,water dikinase
VAGGPVFLVRDKKDINEFPEQGVLVAPELLPEWELGCAMQKASAILSDSGKTNGSVASLARRFRIPFILGLKDATKRLFNGELLTIDADENVVYEGFIKELINYYLIEELGYGDELEYQMFQMVQDKVANLSLTNCETRDFNINSCQTIHDLAYLACENAIKGLIKGDSYRKEFFRASKLLKWGTNMVFQVIDIGDGLKSADFYESTISFEDIQSRPMIALGEKIFTSNKWVDIGFSQRKEEDSSAIADSVSFNKKNFVVLSKEYLNLIINLGFEIDMVDSYICEESELNYIFCRFSNLKGEYRPRFNLAREVMQQLSFEIEETPIALSAWISQLSPLAVEERLHIIGNLINFIHILDEGGYSNMSSESISRFFFRNIQRAEMNNRDFNKGD